jgi:replicative DNA helicase
MRNANRRETVLQARSLGELQTDALELVQRRFESLGRSGPTTGLLDLDRLVGSLSPGTLVLVQGTAGSGKSSLLITAALANGRADVRTVLVSTQTPNDELALRLLAARSDVDLDRLRNAQLLEDHWLQLDRSFARGLPLEIASSGSFSLRRMIRAGLTSRPGVLLIDDAPSIPLSTALRHARLNALDPLEIVIRSAPCPIFASAGIGSSLGMIADVVVTLQLRNGPEPGRLGKVDVVVTKNRRGPTGRVTALVRQTGGVLVDVVERSED